MAADGPVGGVAFLSGAPIVVEQWAEKLQVCAAPQDSLPWEHAAP